MNKIALVLIVLALGACKCPPGLAENLANVEKITKENNELRKAANVEDIDGIKAGRNKEALELATKMAKECE